MQIILLAKNIKCEGKVEPWMCHTINNNNNSITYMMMTKILRRSCITYVYVMCIPWIKNLFFPFFSMSVVKERKAIWWTFFFSSVLQFFACSNHILFETFNNIQFPLSSKRRKIRISIFNERLNHKHHGWWGWQNLSL